MSDALMLPVGADLTQLHQAFATISSSAARMGERVNASMTGSQAAFNRLPASVPSITGAFQGAFSRIGSSGQAAFQGLSAAVRTTATTMSAALATVGVAGGVGGIGAGIALTMKSISSAANMEGLETAFVPLLGGADKAQARIKELANFAAATPFELPEVAKASRVLETLTKGALSTGEGLRMVGDVAATTGQPFDEVAVTIGRLYDGLQSGRPVGEALARLQELGAVSGDVRGRIEDLQESGAAVNEVWGVAAGALGKFTGAMAAQSQTWNGKLSNLRDSVSMAMAEFGKPIMDALKPYLDSASKMAASLGKSAADFGKKVAESIKFISAAFSSGQVGALLGSSIKLGFITAANFLWRSLNGAFAAAGQYLIEYFKTAVELIGIVTTADFWSGVGNALIGIFLDVIAFFQKGLSAALEAVRPLAEMIGQGDKVTSAQSGLNESAGILREEASSKYGQAGQQLAPAMDRIMGRLQTGLENIGNRASEAFKNAGDLIDPEGAAKEVRQLVEKIDAHVKGAQQEIAATTQGVGVTPQLPGTGDGKDKKGSVSDTLNRAAAPAVMSLTRIGGGGFANTVMSSVLGPSPANVAAKKQMAAEPQKQEGFLKTIAGHTKTLVSNTDPARLTSNPAVYA
jgi:hypothetical protein